MLELFYPEIHWNVFSDIYLNCRIHLLNENSVLPILIQKNFQQKIYFSLLKMRSIFLKKENPIFSIKLGQRLLKSFSQLHVKNSRFFLPYFLKQDNWPKAYAGPRLTLSYSNFLLAWQESHFVFFLWFSNGKKRNDFVANPIKNCNEQGEVTG